MLLFGERTRYPHIEQHLEGEETLRLSQAKLYDGYNFSGITTAAASHHLLLPPPRRGRSISTGAGTTISHGQHERIAGEGEVSTRQARAAPRLDRAQYLSPKAKNERERERERNTESTVNPIIFLPVQSFRALCLCQFVYKTKGYRTFDFHKNYLT